MRFLILLANSLFVDTMFTENKNNTINPDKNSSGSNIVLIVEDDPASYQLLKELLSHTFEKTHLEKTGHQAIEFFKQNSDNIAMIIMDIILPEMDGVTATQLIRKENSDVPILGISADVTNHNKKLCLEAGCDYFLPKPLDINKFLRIVNKTLSVKV